MKIFGLEIRRAQKALNSIPQYSHGWRTIHEPFSGAWQRNLEERYADLLCYPTLYACVSRIAQDIAKLPFRLVENRAGIWVPIENPGYSPVLRKPNYFQTAQQFRESWVLSREQHGNAYILKERDNRNVVTSLYVLDPCRVKPAVSDSGDVFYEIWNWGHWNLPPLPPNTYFERDNGNTLVPAREIIHDRANTFHHPLIGVPPLCAAYWPAVKNLRILRNAADFFGNNAQPGGLLTAPAGMSDADADAIKQYWADNFTGENAGKVAVIGADMKFTAFSINSVDSQMVEQMKYSDEQICQPFGIKPYKIGIGNPPGGWKADDVNVEYYGDALSPIIEAMENLLDEGLGIKPPLGAELDTDPLWRMDEGKMADVETRLVGGKVKTPDEARRKFNLASTGGGDTLWGQHQDYPLGVLAEREDLNPVAPEPAPDPDIDNERAVGALLREVMSNV
jgi:HK97 family phage portal protein